MALDYGLKVSKAGDNVLTAADDVLVFTSKAKTFKVFSSGSASVTTDSNGDVTSEVTHSLGYAPAFIALRKTGTVQTKALDVERPEQSADDCYIDNSNIYLADNNMKFGNGGFNAGVRFTSVPIPASATIKYAKIRLYGYTAESGDDCKIRIEGEKNVNVGAFTDRANYNSKPSTTAQISWTVPHTNVDTAFDTPDLTSIVQELVNQSGWGTSDKSMIFMFKDNGSSSGAKRDAYQWDGTLALMAMLYVWYEETAFASNAYFPNVNNVLPDLESAFQSLAYSDSSKLYLRMVGNSVDPLAGASPNTPYTFKYYILSDLAESYSGAQGAGAKNYGIKVSADGYNVLDAKPYQLAYSSRFAALKIDNSLVGSGTISLSAKNLGDPIDRQNLDITHGLGYPPFFLGFHISSIHNTTWKLDIPHTRDTGGSPSNDWNIYGYCDSTKVRFTVWRDPGGTAHSAETVTIKYYIFREDLSLL